MANYTIDDYDENFLLNDDNIQEKSQTPRGEIIWTRNKDQKRDWNQTNNTLFNEACGAVIPTIIDDHGDNLEDSPLLINVSVFIEFFFNI